MRGNSWCHLDFTRLLSKIKLMNHRSAVNQQSDLAGEELEALAITVGWAMEDRNWFRVWKINLWKELLLTGRIYYGPRDPIWSVGYSDYAFKDVCFLQWLIGQNHKGDFLPCTVRVLHCSLYHAFEKHPLKK